MMLFCPFREQRNSPFCPFFQQVGFFLGISVGYVVCPNRMSGMSVVGGTLESGK